MGSLLSWCSLATHKMITNKMVTEKEGMCAHSALKTVRRSYATTKVPRLVENEGTSLELAFWWSLSDTFTEFVNQKGEDVAASKNSKRQKHTTGGIPRWSPTLVLVARFSAYVWQSGRDAQFSLTYGRMC